MADIAIRSRSDTPGALSTYIILPDRCYTRSVKTIASSGTLRRLRHHMSHLLDLRCRPHHRVCSPFEVEGEGEGEGELIAEVVIEMVGQVMV